MAELEDFFDEIIRKRRIKKACGRRRESRRKEKTAKEAGRRKGPRRRELTNYRRTFKYRNYSE